MSELRWIDIENLYFKERWSDFIKAAESSMASGWEEQAHWWTMLSHAYAKIGKRVEAKRCLERGVERHPNEPVCHAFLGTWLATESTGHPEIRSEAIRRWKTALDLESKTMFSTFRPLREEITALEKLPISDPYPPVKKRVVSYVSKLKSAGLFENLSVKDVLRMAIEELGASLVQAKGEELESFVILDRSRYRACDWRFSAEDLLTEVAPTLLAHGAIVKSLSESDAAEDGSRTVSFSVGTHQYSCQIEGADELLRAVNKALKAANTPVNFYHMRRSKFDDGYEFLLLRDSEAMILMDEKLVSLDRL
ncbi:MAG: hypothetical protein K8T20_05455 [Planctomycetes bacterium]|nr:hypothetical protein [Planctomycetota bacterium]